MGKAYRKRVIHRALVASFAATVALFFGGCSDAGPPATEFRGRVIDQDTGQGIAGAIVAGKYVGSVGGSGASSCNRVESAVSDQNGWFTLPLDSKDGQPLMEAYHREYRFARSTRKAGPYDRDGKVWKVEIHRWDEDNQIGAFVGYEPESYRTEEEAVEASGERKDVYLKRSNWPTKRRLQELHRLHVAASCGGPQQTTAGPVPFFEALYAEEVELGDDARFLEMTRDDIRSAEWKSAHARKGK